ncbi:MAG: molybdopterin-dependent oxidoreductase [Chitinophagales bacterium]
MKDWEQRKEMWPAASLRRRNLRAVVVLGLMLIAGWGLWQWMIHQPVEGRILSPLRKVLGWNERLFEGAMDTSLRATSYSGKEAVKLPRVNGSYGMTGTLDTASWRMMVVRCNGDTLKISLAALQQLPKTEVIFDFKCIEGWSQVTHWGGVKLKTFCERYGLQEETAKHYVGLETPDGGYYVGIDMKSALHDQTILCYEMNGKPLPANQGYPLRLIIPVKYGVKHLKRIGTMFFSDDKPRDYWAEHGYDYYCGH